MEHLLFELSMLKSQLSAQWNKPKVKNILKNRDVIWGDCKGLILKLQFIWNKLFYPHRLVKKIVVDDREGRDYDKIKSIQLAITNTKIQLNATTKKKKEREKE